MTISTEVKDFIAKLESKENFKPVAELIRQDLNKCRVDITDLVLKNRLKLEGSWSSYVASDVNVLYEEDMLKVIDLLKMYGLRDKLPNLKADDTALISNYRFDLFDAYGNVMDATNVFHITIKGAVGEDDVINEWYLLYDV